MRCTFCSAPDAMWEGIVQGEPMTLCFACWQLFVYEEDAA